MAGNKIADTVTRTYQKCFRNCFTIRKKSIEIPKKYILPKKKTKTCWQTKNKLIRQYN